MLHTDSITVNIFKMRVELQTWAVILLFLSGVICSKWKVEYQRELICAVKGSAVSIPCLFNNSENQEVQHVWWGHANSSGKKKILTGKAARGFQYIGDKLRNCSLKIHQVGHNHAGKYMVIFNKANRFLIDVAPILNVVDLTISMTKSSRNEAMKEGDSVNLTCVNICDDNNASSAFTWFKDGESIYEGPFLHFRNMSPSVSGNYSCSLKTYFGTVSRAVHIDVEYGPKNTSLTVRRPGAADTGGNFTLICSSDSNPAVENYTWFKAGGEEILPVGHQPVFSPADSGQYFCSVTNKHGSQISSTVEINMRKYHETISRNMLFIVGVTVGAFLIMITAILVIRLRKKRLRPENTDCDEDEQNTDYVNWLESETVINHPSDRGMDGVYCSTLIIYNTRRANLEQHAEQDRMDPQNVIYSTVDR